jgi:osmoprotectant transport system ATP-binding protein
MIEAHQLRKEFGSRTVIEDVSLRVGAGEKLVLLGPSGCGKTTLLRMLNRLEEPTAGRIFFEGVDTSTLDPAIMRRRMGYVIQGGGLLPHRTVRENILTVPRLLGWPQEKCDDALFVLKAILWMFDDWFDAYPRELSNGQRQRVALARALIANPPLVLMDEPFSALDPVSRVQIRREIHGLWVLREKAIILITHDVAEAFEFGDRIALMSPGRIEQVGTAAELLFQPKNEFVRRFFDGQRIYHEWQAVHLRDLVPPGGRESQAPWLGLPPTHTVAEAMSLIGSDPLRTAQLTAAYQVFKNTRPGRPESAPKP